MKYQLCILRTLHAGDKGDIPEALYIDYQLDATIIIYS